MAAPKTAKPTAKNHSTSVKKQKSQKATQRTGSRKTASSNEDAIAQALARRRELLGGARLRALDERGETAAAAETPRAAEKTGVAPGRSLPSPQPTKADDASVQAALERRRNWSEPRQSLLEPAQVQDPPAVAGAERPGELSRDDEGLLAAADTGSGTPNEDLIREALKNRGKPYIWGGASRGGFDCSGFVVYLFKKMRGASLPHSASAQSRLGTPVAREDLQPGDLVFFSTYRRGVSHVGIYIGNNRFIHAANTRKDVRIDSLTGYYHNRYKWARRVSPAPLRFRKEDLDELIGEPSVPPVAEGG